MLAVRLSHFDPKRPSFVILQADVQDHAWSPFLQRDLGDRVLFADAAHLRNASRVSLSIGKKLSTRNS
jgi:hypothetical protein